MESRELVIAGLRKMVSNFNDIHIRYEFQKNKLTHFIEVQPKELYDSNDSYLDAEIELQEKFFDLFPNEDIVFMSEDIFGHIKTPYYSHTPNLVDIRIEKKESIPLYINNINFNINRKSNLNNYALAA